MSAETQPVTVHYKLCCAVSIQHLFAYETRAFRHPVKKEIIRIGRNAYIALKFSCITIYDRATTHIQED
jgi:hypothetical protein